MSAAILYVPCPDRKTAANLVKRLVDKKMVACGNIHKSKSYYIWDKKMVKQKEWISVMKTLSSFVVTAKKEILKWHPYEIPAVLHWPAESNESYIIWLEEQLG